jgi:hypothetical protein
MEAAISLQLLVVSNSFNGTITLGGPTDLWGGSWTLADVAATGFGFNFHVAASTNSRPPSLMMQARHSILSKPIPYSSKLSS